MLNISSYTSQNPTSIISSNMDITSPPSSSSIFVAGGRALDRHNPIITDEKRSGICSNPATPLGTPRTNHVLQHKPKTPLTPNPLLNSPTTRKKKNNNKSLLKMTKNIVTQPSFVVDHNIENHDEKVGEKGLSEPSDLITKSATCDVSRPNVEYISPPESSRYLLDDDTSFLDALSGFDPVLKLESDNSSDSNHVEVSKVDDFTKSPKNSSSSGSSDQVVVLRVSLHCRGCERKMKKHLSRMSGVTSFNIDFVAKKVTVVGDVTPLQVLAIISKVKTAKLWSPTTPSSSHIATINTEDEK